LNDVTSEGELEKMKLVGENLKSESRMMSMVRNMTAYHCADVLLTQHVAQVTKVHEITYPSIT
jgi:hypothetical protein